MPTCCVPGCTSGYRNDTSPSVRHFFSAPSDERLRAAWNRAIPRADKDLTTKSRVCSIHFHDQDIRKTYVHVINGETVEIPRGKWSLVEGALPKAFPNLPSYLSKPAEKMRKRQRESNGNADQGTASPQSQASCSTIPADVVVDDMPEPSAPSFAEMECVELPPSWQRITEENSSGKFAAFFTLTSASKAPQIEKCVVVSSDGVATASARGRKAKAFLSVSIKAMLDLSDLINKVHSLHACSGYDVQSSTGFSLRCQALAKQSTCSFCRNEKNRLLKKNSHKQKRQVCKQKKVKNLQKKAIRAAAARVSFMKNMAELKEKLTSERSSSINEHLMSLPPLQQIAFKMSLKQIEAKGPQGVRYTRSWVLNCLLLHISSPKAYNLIRKMNLLPLPTTSRLNQVLSGVPCNNRSMWTHLGISGKLHHPVNKIPHPTLEDGRFLHFLCDVPHIIKCVRNHLLTHTYAMAGTNCINFQHYVHLYEAEKDSHLKIVPKFTSSHVKPSKLEKMNVRLATQLFSRSVAIGMKFYREQREPGLKDSEGTEMFTMQVNDLFDVLNAKHPATGIRKNSPKIKRFFGVVRSFGGDEDHPTIVHFGQIFRLLSLYTPLKMATKGNCTGDADPVLVTMEESLSSKRLEVLHQKKEREDKLGQLMHSIVLEKLPEEDANQHDYGRPTPHDAALYYLAGYVVKKAEKFSSCGDCKATLLATNDVPSAAILTEMRSFVPGALQLPSKDLTSLLTDVESAITERTRDNVVFGDLFWCIVKDLTQGHSLAQVGCGVHSEELSARIIKFYLVTRMHFYARFLRQHKDTSVQVKVARKRARLL
ncbi:hypothetical protein HPB51_021543 [Rhipicephalus microplus]|uniref:THAP-type domain-containing protein n=1 Tax=Rhipicephalus microplus TaxID=6941 RepID=A0A9J6ECT1_RHIMP|nr:hypothetical protein HPB51_021543 [Rhipicephalus microplus]